MTLLFTIIISLDVFQISFFSLMLPFTEIKNFLHTCHYHYYYYYFFFKGYSTKALKVTTHT